MEDPPELHEDVELDLERRRYILDLYRQLDELSSYELLRVARDADVKTIRRAYFAAVAVVHPDRFFGKRLGSYGPKLEKLFSRMTLAWEVLSDGTRRAEYDATLPNATASKTPSTRAKAPLDPKAADAQRQAMEALKARFTDGKAKARTYADAGARARSAGDLVGAAEAYAQALRFAPQDAEVKAALDEVTRSVADKRAANLTQKAALEERLADALRQSRSRKE